MGIGITVLAELAHVHAALSPTQLGLAADATMKTVLAQVASAVFGAGSIGFYAIQAFTAAILVLAANTSFNGFPGLASILARDRYLPRQFHARGDRLVFSNGIVLLALFAAVLIYAFDANTDALIQLYVIGVFIAFTLSQGSGWSPTGTAELSTVTEAGAALPHPPAPRRSTPPAPR